MTPRGLPGAVSSSPRWLRLVRSGGMIIGYDSADGSRWTVIGSATLTGLPSSVQAGLFVASPQAYRSGGYMFTQANAGSDDISPAGRLVAGHVEPMRGRRVRARPGPWLRAWLAPGAARGAGAGVRNRVRRRVHRLRHR